jgi:hypothetical protein
MNRSEESARGEPGQPTCEERVQRLETQMETIIEAIGELARGLEGSPMAEPRSGHAERAARRTHELLLLAKSAPLETSAPE